MSHRLVVVALLLSMLLRAATSGMPQADMGGGQAALHAVLHWAGLGHHHHRPPAAPAGSADLADANAAGHLHVSAVAGSAWSVDRDQSPESTQHVLMDGYVSGAAMIASWPAALPAEPLHPALPNAGAERVPAAPFLEGLHRPPRLAA